MSRRQDTLVLRSPGGRFSRRYAVRAAWVTCGLVGTTLCLGIADLCLGAYPTPLASVLRALSGGGDEAVRLVVLEWRLPRIAAALIFGSALGLSGAIFQALARNPLGSPDLIGIDAGAMTGMLLASTVLGLTGQAAAAGAFAGGATAGLATWLLAGRTNGLDFILVGIGIAMMLTALNTWVMAGLRLEVAVAAATWFSGALQDIEPLPLALVTLPLFSLMLVAIAVRRHLRVLELGEAVAVGLGIRVGALRATLVATGAALSIIVTATAGPIGFVALAAPQLARLLAGTGALPLPAAAAMGALLLVTADLVAAHLFAPLQLPVGRVTLVGGGAYLVWMLLRDALAKTSRHA